MESIMGWATYELRDRTSYFLGFPVKLSILSSWFRVELPGKSGFPSNNSPKIHPTLHTSALLS